MCFQAGSARLLTGEPFCLQALRDLFLPKVLPSRKLSWIEKVNKSSQNYFPVFQCVCALCWRVRGKHSRTLLVQKASKSAAFLEMCWARVCCCAGVFRLTFLFSSLTMYSLTKRAWIFSTIACWEREEGIIIHLSFAWGHNKPCVRMEEKTILAAVRHAPPMPAADYTAGTALVANFPRLVTPHPGCWEFLCALISMGISKCCFHLGRV